VHYACVRASDATPFLELGVWGAAAEFVRVVARSSRPDLAQVVAQFEPPKTVSVVVWPSNLKWYEPGHGLAAATHALKETLAWPLAAGSAFAVPASQWERDCPARGQSVALVPADSTRPVVVLSSLSTTATVLAVAARGEMATKWCGPAGATTLGPATFQREGRVDGVTVRNAYGDTPAVAASRWKDCVTLQPSREDVVSVPAALLVLRKWTTENIMAHAVEWVRRGYVLRTNPFPEPTEEDDKPAECERLFRAAERQTKANTRLAVIAIAALTGNNPTSPRPRSAVARLGAHAYDKATGARAKRVYTGVDQRVQRVAHVMSAAKTTRCGGWKPVIAEGFYLADIVGFLGVNDQPGTVALSVNTAMGFTARQQLSPPT